MRLITVPFDYNEDLHPEVVPICIRDTDRKGNPVHLEWIEFGVVPAADKLRDLTKRVLHDVFRVSEVVEHVVHAASRKRGADLGTHPDFLIRAGVTWRAKDLARGGRRLRTGQDVELFTETIEQLRDQLDLVKATEAKDTLDKLVAIAIELGMDEAVAMVPMMLRGCSAEEYVRRFGKRRNTLTQLFFRHMRKAADKGGLSF